MNRSNPQARQAGPNAGKPPRGQNGKGPSLTTKPGIRIKRPKRPTDQPSTNGRHNGTPPQNQAITEAAPPPTKQAAPPAAQAKPEAKPQAQQQARPQANGKRPHTPEKTHFRPREQGPEPREAIWEVAKAADTAAQTAGKEKGRQSALLNPETPFARERPPATYQPPPGMATPTEEQLQVIYHPAGCHGRVLSVAGSGKTSTMVHRIYYLLRQRGVQPDQIQVLMFNSRARADFKKKLTQAGLNYKAQPRVDTFHSYALGIIKQYIPKPHYKWYGENTDQADLALRIIIDQLAKDRRNEARAAGKENEHVDLELDFEEAHNCISLWKDNLTPPSCAGHSGTDGNEYVEVYRRFETERQRKNAITFADYLPLALELLNEDPRRIKETAGRLKYLIVDEYQDVNYGQQRLIEIMAEQNADVMVIGDDDQTIYEWRGARADYILGEFQQSLSDKPHRRYKLTQSFRFGYQIAQTAYNVIAHNAKREAKMLVAADPGKGSKVRLFQETADHQGQANRQLTSEILRLVEEEKVKPIDIRVLGRCHAQLDDLSAELLGQEIPFKTVNHRSFLERAEAQTLFNYVRVAEQLDKIPNIETEKALLNIANKPSRYLARRMMEGLCQSAREQFLPLEDILEQAGKESGAPRGLLPLYYILYGVKDRLDQDPPMEAGALLDWTESAAGLSEHYQSYYGKGETSTARIDTMNAIIEYARSTGLAWPEFYEQVAQTDTTLGYPEEQLIHLMTIHATKGEEFDYVIIPDCREGFMPVLAQSEDPTYDKRRPNRTPKAAEWLENERRLFYVAATRAKRELLIGCPELPGENGPKAQKKKDQDHEEKCSRFLEETEHRETAVLAKELAAAANRRGNQLAEAAQSCSDNHRLLEPLKNEYSRMLEQIETQMRKVSLDVTSRAFGYQQSYSSPFDRDKDGKNRNGKPTPVAAPPQGVQATIWSHLKNG